MPKRITLTISDENLKILRKEFDKLGSLAGDDFQMFLENYIENTIDTQLHFLNKNGGIEKVNKDAKNIFEKLINSGNSLEDMTKTIENLLGEFGPELINELNDLGLKKTDSKEKESHNNEKKTKKS
jgi:hypothetical protein